MNNNYLEHHGIKGQKWGVRRFQNPDGTRTELGKKRERSNDSYDEGSLTRKRRAKTAAAAAAGLAAATATGFGARKVSKHVDRNKLFDRTLIKGGKDKPSISPAEKLAKETGNVASEAGKIAKTARKVKDLKNEREAKQLSDQELRDRINRMNLEKQYESLIEEDYARGHITADDILSTVGSVVSIGGSVAAMIAVASMVKK